MPFHKRKLVINKILRAKVIRKIPTRHVAFDIHKHFDDEGFKLHLLDHGPSQTVELAKEASLKYYRDMSIIRKVENECATLYREKFMRGFCHLYTGQEAIAVGIHSVLRPQDSVITSYRCHAWCALMCDNLVGIFAEFIGHVCGISRGKGGSMHIYAKNFYGGNGIVGAHVSLGAGIALKHKYSGTDAISVCLFGDGAANQGQVFESYNISKLHMLPIIYVIENNNYGMGTTSQRSSANPEHYRQCAYIPGIRVNGNEILAVIEATKFAMQHVLDGKGPIILEMMTYRYFGHSMSDPGTSYRSREEIKQVREEKDPINHLTSLMLKSNLATEEEIKNIKNQAENEVHQAVETAMKDKPPPIEELTADCYQTFPGRMRTSRMLTYLPHKNFGKYNDIKKYNFFLLYLLIIFKLTVYDII